MDTPASFESDTWKHVGFAVSRYEKVGLECWVFPEKNIPPKTSLFTSSSSLSHSIIIQPRKVMKATKLVGFFSLLAESLNNVSSCLDLKGQGQATISSRG